MLYWLLQSQAAHPALVRGEPPRDLLAVVEQIEFDRFTSANRRQSWLLGRWTAKRLLQQVAGQRAESMPPSLYTIIIQTAKNGAPYTQFRDPQSGRGYSLSLSHKHDYALCAVVEEENLPVGADLEWTESRDADFVQAFFNPQEQALVSDGPACLRDVHATAIWSAKEAAFKAAASGTRLDPRSISCLIQPVAVEPQNWTSFEILWQWRKSGRQCLPLLTGWWQTLGGFVLTVALPADRSHSPEAY